MLENLAIISFTYDMESKETIRPNRNQPTPTVPYSVQFRELAEARRFSYVAYLYISLVVPYLIWRSTIVNWHVWYGPVALLADIYGIITTSLFVIITRRVWEPVHRPTSFNRNVDILIPTYNEPLEVVESTAIGAINVRGRRDVLLLDDGNRPEFRQMAKRLSIYYYPRTTNEHAKAGNMNNGLVHTDAELIMTLDADHVPLPHFLERTLGYFDDPKVGFVQTPQSFYNQDSFLFRKRRHGKWSEQGMFYDCIQPSKNRWNSAFFVGTSAVLRRSALDSVGGFATGTATEDIHTSLRLHAHGWKSVFVPEALAYGLESENLKEFYKQRRRWAAGSLGLLFRSPDSPLRARGLSVAQRANYIAACLAHLQGVQKLLYFIIPIACIFTLTGPVTLNLAVFNLVFVGYLALALSVTNLYSRGTYHFLYTEAYNLANMMAHFGGIKGIIKVQRKFAVSNKVAIRRERTWLKKILWIMVGASVLGLARVVELDLAGNFSALVVSSMVFIDVNFLALIAFLIHLNQYEAGEVDKPNLIAPINRYRHVHETFYAPIPEIALKHTPPTLRKQRVSA